MLPLLERPAFISLCADSAIRFLKTALSAGV